MAMADQQSCTLLPFHAYCRTSIRPSALVSGCVRLKSQTSHAHTSKLAYIPNMHEHPVETQSDKDPSRVTCSISQAPQRIHQTEYTDTGTHACMHGGQWAWAGEGRGGGGGKVAGGLGRLTTLKDNSSRLVHIHHLLHDRLEHIPELAVSQARLKRDVQSVVLAGAKTDFINATGAWKEQLTIPVEAHSHHPTGIRSTSQASGNGMHMHTTVVTAVSAIHVCSGVM